MRRRRGRVPSWTRRRGDRCPPRTREAEAASLPQIRRPGRVPPRTRVVETIVPLRTREAEAAVLPWTRRRRPPRPVTDKEARRPGEGGRQRPARGEGGGNCRGRGGGGSRIPSDKETHRSGEGGSRTIAGEKAGPSTSGKGGGRCGCVLAAAERSHCLIGEQETCVRPHGPALLLGQGGNGDAWLPL